MVNPFSNGMEVQERSQLQRQNEREAQRYLAQLGNSEGVTRFASKYGIASTKRIYLISLVLYFRWLKSIGVVLTPDELVEDNLKCFFNSQPTDVRTKRRHTDWLDRYINRNMVEEGYSESMRTVTAAAIQQFYRRNDSQLFGDFQVARSPAAQRPKPLESSDIRKVLAVMPLNLRLPLLIMWQSGVEINRALSLRWRNVEGIERGDCPLRLEFLGRKLHRRPYHTYVGRESVEHLRGWSERWRESMGREPGPDDLILMGKRRAPISYMWLEHRLKEMAMRLARQGLVKNGEVLSWHTHALRHSFSTECSHAGIKPEVREYFMGHISGVSWVYQHPELHEEDLVKEYLRVEPFVSLNESEVTLKDRFESREKQLLSRILDLERNYEELKREVLSRT